MKETLEEEMHMCPSRDIAADMAAAAEQIFMIARKSGNLQEGYIKLLKDAALQVKVGGDALATRAQGALPPEVKEREKEAERISEENVPPHSSGGNYLPPKGDRGDEA